MLSRIPNEPGGLPADHVAQVAQRWYPRLALGTVVVGYVLIVVGGIVRVNGAIVPVFRFETAIEYTHRMVAAAVVVLTFGLIVTGFAAFRWNRRFVGLPILAFGLVLAQAILGAVTVALELPPSVVMAHLGTAELYLATLIILVVLVHPSQIPVIGRSDRLEGRTRLRWLAAGAAASVFVLMLSGAYTATSGAGYACPEWPLCQGHYVPTGWTVIDVQLLHRWLALIAAVAVAALTVEALRHRTRSPFTARIAVATAGIMLAQIFVGAANIWFKLAPAVSAVHLAVATVIWGLLIMIAAIEHLAPAETVHTQELSRASGRSERHILPVDHPIGT